LRLGCEEALILSCAARLAGLPFCGWLIIGGVTSALAWESSGLAWECTG